MKLYRTSYIDDAESNRGSGETHFSWTGTLANAASDRKRLKTEGMREIKTDEADVPTDKAGLLAYLNANS